MLRTTRALVPALFLTAALHAQDDGKATVKVPGATTSPPSFGTNTNVTLVKQWRRTTGGYNDIWGWTSPTGREFAYVGEKSGIWFVECTDPKNIKQIGWWSSPTSTWRDFTNYGHYVYSVSEHHAGIRIFDMSKPDSPKDLGYVQTTTIKNTHNISVDPATGYLYLSGTNQGLAIFDAKKNPTNPPLLGKWTTAYTHDCCVRRGKAYLSNGRSYVCRIMDTTNPAALKEIGKAPTPGGYDHNVWVSEDDQVMCVTDELSSSTGTPHLSIWDISKPSSPVKKGDYDINYTVHNVFVMGRTAYMSHYLEGFHMVDLADLTKPSKVANYDTSTYTTLWHGCWGVYPFTDSGLIYCSDIENGLYVLQVDAGHLNRYGDGTPGSTGLVPRMRFDGATPRVAASKLRLEIENLLPNARFAFAIAGSTGTANLLGVKVHVNLSGAYIFLAKADANGKASIAAPIPDDSSLASQKMYMQIVSEDASNSGGFSASRGMWVGIAAK